MAELLRHGVFDPCCLHLCIRSCGVAYAVLLALPLYVPAAKVQPDVHLMMWCLLAAGVPITFDFHHHRFCKGGLTEEQAFKAAIATWPKGVRPQVTLFLDYSPSGVLNTCPGLFPPFTFDPTIMNSSCTKIASDCHVSVGLHVVQLISSPAWQ